MEDIIFKLKNNCNKVGNLEKWQKIRDGFNILFKNTRKDRKLESMEDLCQQVFNYYNIKGTGVERSKFFKDNEL